jgi:hypothetical protein
VKLGGEKEYAQDRQQNTFHSAIHVSFPRLPFYIETVLFYYLSPVVTQFGRSSLVFIAMRVKQILRRGVPQNDLKNSFGVLRLGSGRAEEI